MSSILTPTFALFALISGMLIASVVLAGVQFYFDLKGMSTLKRVLGVACLVLGTGLVGAIVVLMHTNIAHYDTFAWAAHFTFAAAALLAQVALIVATLKTRQASNHERRRSPERYQPHAWA